MAQPTKGYALSSQQRLVWRLRQQGSPNCYTSYCCVTIDGRIERQKLLTALEMILERNEILRTNFGTRHGLNYPLQFIRNSHSLNLSEVDLEKLSEADQLVQLDRIITQADLPQTDLTTELPFFARIYKASEFRRFLLLGLPALCADGTTMVNLVDELAQCFREAADNEQPALPNLQYLDIAEWQNDLMESDETKGGRTYWIKQVAGLKPTQSFLWRKTNQQPHPPMTGFYFFAQDERLLKALRLRASAEGLTIIDLLLTSWCVLLRRYSEDESIVVKAACDGRTSALLKNALGPLTKFLPFQTGIDLGSALADIAKKVSREYKEIVKWADYFDWENVYPGTKDGLDLISPFSFECRFYPGRHLADKITFSIIRCYACVDQFGLKLTCSLNGDAASAEIHYDSQYFSPPQIERIAAQWQKILYVLADSPESRICDIDMVGDSERQLLIEEGYNAAAASPLQLCVQELFVEQVRLTPDRIAAIFEERHISYEELYRYSNQLAGFLRLQGICEEKVVAIYSNRSVETLISVLGVLIAGGAYLPLDPGMPDKRLGFILNDANVALVLSSDKFEPKLSKYGVKVISPGANWNDILTCDANTDIRQIDSESICYVMYTSGSTGKPKGVMVSHCGLVNYLCWCLKTYPVAEGTGSPLHSPLVFDLTVTSLFTPLLAGRTVTILREEEELHALAEHIRRQEGFSLVKLTPARLSLLAELCQGFEIAGATKCLVIGGEPLHSDILTYWRDHAPAIRLINEYGPTETVVGCCAYEAPKDFTSSGAVPIGRPISNVGINLLDSELRLVPVGLPGEIYISGEGLARGYINQPDLTADRFRPNPFGHLNGARLYKTGDLACYQPDWNLEFLGRSDQQIKLRGYRIELGEIEAVLREHAGVQDVVVTAGKGEGQYGGQRLIAYVVPDSQRAAVVRNWLRLKAKESDGSYNTYELPNGLLVYHLNRKETDYLYREIFLDKLYLGSGIELADGACVLDIGANIGLFSLWVKKNCRGAQVFAFEPIPPIYEALERNVKLYGNQIHIFPYGLSSISGKETFSFYPNLSLMSGRFPEQLADREVVKVFEKNRGGSNHASSTWAEEIIDEVIDDRLDRKCFDCPVTTISEVIRQNKLSRVDLLKIDAEKSELDVLTGIEAEDWGKIKQIVIEVHDIEGRLNQVTTLFKGRGYQVTVCQEPALEGSNLYLVYAVRDCRIGQVVTHVPERNEVCEKTTWEGPGDLIKGIQNYLRERLPDYMVPDQVVLLDALPLTSNHKIDRRALPMPENSGDLSVRQYLPPVTPTERLLARIWQEVLGKERIGVDESFFALGGDSIMSIQVIARANRAGLHLTPRQFFRHQTIKDLAAVANEAPLPQAEGETSSQEILLTPAQHWFFEQSLSDYSHYNQSVLLEFDDLLDVTSLNEALRAMVASHDAFHLRFYRQEYGWRQVLAGRIEEAQLPRIDLSELSDEKQKEVIERVSDDLQKSLDLSNGPIFRIALFRLNSKPRWRLLLIIHHLGVDGVSWRILLEELDQLYGEFQSGGMVRSGFSSGFRNWAQHLKLYAGRGAGLSELKYWTRTERKNVSPVPVDFVDGENSQESCRTVSVSLTEEETESLLQDVCSNLQVNIEEVLLTALLLAVARWTGRNYLLLDLERHGRDPIIGGDNILRAVGWFTTTVPVLLKTEYIADPGAALRQVKTQMRGIPNQGIHYGVLRYLCNDGNVVETLKALPQPQICFNYLGQFDHIFSPVTSFHLAKESTGNNISPEAKRGYLLDWVGWVSTKQLRFDCRYSENQFRRSTIEDLMSSFIQALKTLITLRRSCGPSYLTNRAPGTELAPHFLGGFVMDGFEIEDIYPLSPIQQGILFHCLSQPETTTYVAQDHCVFTGAIEVAALKDSWQKVIDLHPAVRTAFFWEGRDDPQQVVAKHVGVPWIYHDWRTLDPREQQLRLERLLEDDWEAGFNLNRPPLMRFALIRKDLDVYDFVWTYHHITIDGWSMALLLKDVFACYKSIIQNRKWATLPPRPYRDYVNWVTERNDISAQKYWGEALKGFRGPTPLWMVRSNVDRRPQRIRYLEEGRQMGEGLKSDLLRMARRERITLNTLVQGAWAMILHRYSGESEVTFGVTLAGRPAELAGSETMIGLFINTLPLRVSVHVPEALSPWLRHIQRQSAELIQYQHSPLIALRGQGNHTHGTTLFESIVVFENYPVDSSLRNVNETIRVQNVRGKVRNHYPVTIRAVPSAGLSLEIMFDEARINVDTIRMLLSHFERLFRHFAARPDDSLGQILDALVAADHQQHLAMEAEFNMTRQQQLKVAKRRSVNFKKPER